MLNEKLNLHFDLYTRNKIISDLIELLRGDKKSLKILDIGGRSGHIKDFLHQKDELYILDIRKSEEKEENYFMGDIINAPFINDIFDVVISSDLYEHISPENRLNSLPEMLRITKNFVILGAPFDTKDVAEAEIQANEYFRKLTGIDHQWLSEHIKNGLPSKKELNDFLIKNGLEYITVETNNISNWLLMQLSIFYGYKYNISIENMHKLWRFYNESFFELGDSFSPTYRTIYLISKNGTLPKISSNFNSVMNRSKYYTLQTLIFETIGLSTDTHIALFEKEIKIRDEQIRTKDEQIRTRDEQIRTKDEQIRTKDEQIRTKDEQIRTKDEQIHIRNQQIARLNESMKYLEVMIASIKSSISWKITSPLRYLHNLLIERNILRR